MNHTPEIKKALQFAARKHDGQIRVTSGEKSLPYVTHLFSAALLVAEDGASDGIVIATLLHDTLEDTDTTRAEIAEAFGESVAELVEAVSEPKEKEGKKLDWKERKIAYLENIAHASDGGLLISIADKIDNIESKLEEYAKEGVTLLRHWKQPNSEYLWFHGEVLRLAQKQLPEHPLTQRLAQVHTKEKEVFG